MYLNTPMVPILTSLTAPEYGVRFPPTDTRTNYNSNVKYDTLYVVSRARRDSSSQLAGRYSPGPGRP